MTPRGFLRYARRNRRLGFALLALVALAVASVVLLSEVGFVSGLTDVLRR